MSEKKKRKSPDAWLTDLIEGREVARLNPAPRVSLASAALIESATSFYKDCAICSEPTYYKKRSKLCHACEAAPPVKTEKKPYALSSKKI